MQQRRFNFGYLYLFFALAFVLSCGKGSSYGSNPNPNPNPNPGPGTTGNTISIDNMAFISGSISVAAGTTITWKNNDGVTHTVTADDDSFDSGNIAPGGQYSRKFETAGSYPYHCTIHPMMTSTITVN